MEAGATDGVKGLLEVIDELRPQWATAANWQIPRNARDVRRKVSSEFAETMFTNTAARARDPHAAV
jgi:hypothetical protein